MTTASPSPHPGIGVPRRIDHLSEPRWVRILFAVPLAFAVLFAVSLVADAWSRGLRP